MRGCEQRLSGFQECFDSQVYNIYVLKRTAIPLCPLARAQTHVHTHPFARYTDLEQGGRRGTAHLGEIGLYL